jgi:hypothetical protein
MASFANGLHLRRQTFMALAEVHRLDRHKDLHPMRRRDHSAAAISAMRAATSRCFRDAQGTFKPMHDAEIRPFVSVRQSVSFFAVNVVKVAA